MWRFPADETVHLNWTAVMSYSGSLVESVVIWVGLFRAVEHLVK